jgi:hypothetical protein
MESGRRSGFAKVLQQAIVMLLGVCLACSGCTTTRAVALDPPPAASAREFEPGRRVAVVLRDGTEIRGWVVAAREDGLTIDSGSSGRPRDVAFRDMKSLQVRDPSKGRTIAAAIGGVLVVAAGVLYLILLERAKHDD